MDTITQRIDAITSISPSYLSKSPPCPKSVKIELTAKCNFNCSFCARKQNLRNQGNMERDFYENVVRDMAQSGIQELGLFYLGESFLVPWLGEAIAFAKNGCKIPYIFLTTNGAMCSEQSFFKVMYAGLSSLKFSLNYASPEQLTSIAGVRGDLFHKIIANIKLVHKIREKYSFKTKLYASYIQYDNKQAEQMKEVIEEVRPYLDEIYALPLYNQAALIRQEDSDWEFTAGNRGRVGALRNPIPCWACFTEGHITWDGNLSACCFDHDGRFHMGNLREMSFMQAWNSDKFQELREAHLSGVITGTVCQKCVAYN